MRTPQLLLTVLALAGAAALAQTPYERDAAKHRKEQQARETHTFKREIAVRKYGVSKAQLQRDAKDPNGKHFTNSGPGRPPTQEAAQQAVGLKKKPRYMLTRRAMDLEVYGKGHDKAAGGKRNVSDLRVSNSNAARITNAKLTELVKKRTERTSTRRDEDKR